MQNCPENECFFGISFLSQKSESTFLSQKTTFLVQKSFRQIMDSFTSVLLSFSILKKNNTIVFSMKSIISRFHGNLLVSPPPVLIGTPPPVPTGTNCTNSGTEGVKRKYPPPLSIGTTHSLKINILVLY